MSGLATARRVSVAAVLLLFVLVASAAAQKSTAQPAAVKVTAQPAASAPLAEHIRQIAEQPLLRHAMVGYEVYDLSEGRMLLEQNADKLFNAGSTTKVLTEGAALGLLGPEFRFHTRVFHTGKLENDGTLEGDLILVAGGDPNLSGRVKPDDTLDYSTSDHSYAGVSEVVPVWGDPLRVMKELAAGVLMKGVARVHGRVLVDASLFPATQVEPATHTVISPLMLNDNVIDVLVTPGAKPGAAATVKLSPDFPYLHLESRVKTAAASAEAELVFTSDVAGADGSHSVVLEGQVPLGHGPSLTAYKVKDPVLYGLMGFRQALEWAGIKVIPPADKGADAARPSPVRTLLTEHLSPPLKEEVRLTLKVSQNLHAATMPYLIGALAGRPEGEAAKPHADAAQRGMALERRWLAEAGLEPETVSQLDGEGGVGSAFSPEFMVRYLGWLARQPYGSVLYDALPVLGRDGTLTEVLSGSPAAGHVHAKTGSYSVANNMAGGVMLLGKGLVGYIEAANHHRLAFAAYANLLPLRSMDDVAEVSHSLAEMAAAAWQFAPGGPPAKPPAAAPASARKAAPPRSPISIIVAGPAAIPVLFLLPERAPDGLPEILAAQPPMPVLLIKVKRPVLKKSMAAKPRPAAKKAATAAPPVADGEGPAEETPPPPPMAEPALEPAPEAAPGTAPNPLPAPLPKAAAKAASKAPRKPAVKAGARGAGKAADRAADWAADKAADKPPETPPAAPPAPTPVLAVDPLTVITYAPPVLPQLAHQGHAPARKGPARAASAKGKKKPASKAAHEPDAAASQR